MREGKELKDGILLVTNIRIIWRRDTFTLMNEYRINFEGAQMMHDPKNNRTVVQIVLKSGNKTHVTFTGKEQKIKGEAFVAELSKKNPDVEDKLFTSD